MAVVDLAFRPRPWQEEVFKSLLRFSVLVVHRRGGKTLLAVMRLIDAALRVKRSRGRYAYIAPLLRQAKDIAWAYLKEYALKVPGTTYNESELWVELPNGSRIRIYGADNPDSLRGLYFDGVVLDEVAQMKRELWSEILMPALADRTGWALFIGTPKGINFFSETYYKALATPGWYAKLYTVHDTKALPAEEVELLKAGNEAAFRQEYLCDFAASSDDSLISIDMAREAGARVLREPQWSYAPKILGVDVAWGGGDRSVIFPRQGLQAFKPTVRQGIPEKDFTSVVSSVIDNWKPDRVFIDTTGGYGGEVLSRLLERGYPVEGVVFSRKADDRFANIRAEMWFKMRDWLKEGGSFLGIGEYHETLIAEMCAPKYTNDNAANRLTLESKDDVRETLGYSPDIADALALTFAYPVSIEKYAVGVKAEWDPFTEGER